MWRCEPCRRLVSVAEGMSLGSRATLEVVGKCLDHWQVWTPAVGTGVLPWLGCWLSRPTQLFRAQLSFLWKPDEEQGILQPQPPLVCFRKIDDFAIPVSSSSVPICGDVVRWGNLISSSWEGGSLCFGCFLLHFSPTTVHAGLVQLFPVTCGIHWAWRGHTVTVRWEAVGQWTETL